MLAIVDFERMIVESFVDDARLDDSTDGLLGHLLSGVAGYGARATDGVIFEHKRVSERKASASGVAIMIYQQTVEPLRVEFTVDASRSHLTAGALWFGDVTRTITYDSREHRRLRKAFLVDPAAEFEWKECFRRDGRGWNHGGAGPSNLR